MILDLGTPVDLKAKYGYDETVGHGQGFASISVRNGKAMILKDYKTGELQEIMQSAALFEKPNTNNEAAPVKSGNIYLMRITDRSDATYELFAKVLVLAFVPNESVTIRWYLMSDAKTSKL